MQDMLDRVFFENSVSDYLLSLGVLVGGILIVWVIKSVTLYRVKAHAKKTATKLDDFLIHIIESKIMIVLFFGVFYLSVQNLLLPNSIEKAINVMGVVVLTVIGIKLMTAVIYHAFDNYFLMGEGEAAKKTRLRRLLPAVKVIIWGLGITFLLDNLGFRISTVVAGLGIGGIAVALAAQAVLGDLFSYFAILLDRPFEIGDFIIVDNYMGTIEYSGIKTTRIRSLGGEQLVFSNTDLTNSRIRNYKRMERRRVVFNLGVTYQTPREKLKDIPKIIEDVIGKVDNAVLDRAHFFEFGDFSLNFEIVYYVLTGDYNVYMDIQQQINLAISEEFARKGIEFAYPTQTLFLNKED